MMQLAAAITSRFPQGNEWAALALEGLADGVGPTTLVHGIAEGWYRRGDGDAAVLVDTLFVLTDDRLGLGQVGSSPAGVPSGAPRWIELSEISAVDAVDRSPLPLQTIEMELADGTAVCVGWPESFSDSLVAALLANVGHAAADADHRLPPELVGGEIADDPSALDGLAPSSWVEQEVTSPDVAVPLVSLDTAPFDVLDAAIVDELGFDGPGGADPWFIDAAVHADPEPAPLDPAVFAAVPEPEPEPDHEFVAASAEMPMATPEFAAAEFAPEFAAAEFAPEPEPEPELEPVPDPAPEPAVVFPSDSLATAPADLPPWRTPGMTWPDPLRGVLYLGGHPGYTRKRKNGTMVFSSAGLDVSGSGFQDWSMSIDWAFLDGIEVQGPDEVMFGDNIKIDSTSSALVVSMTDGTRMFFEIRTRRPPSLRSTLAPVLLLVDSARAWRAQRPAT